MPPIKDDAICIRHWDWSETSQTVSLFTRTHGIVRGLAKGARRENAAFSGGIELLTRGELLAILKSGIRAGNLATLTAWDLQETFARIRSSLPHLHAATFLVDLAHHSLEELDPHPALFDVAVSCLRHLDQHTDPQRVILRFQWAALCETGYRPDFDDEVPPAHLHDNASASSPAAAGAWIFLPRSGRFTRQVPLTTPLSRDPTLDAPRNDAWKVRPETVRLLRLVASRGDSVDSPIPDADTSISNETVIRCNSLLASYFASIHDRWPASIRWILPDHPFLKSAGSQESA